MSLAVASRTNNTTTPNTPDDAAPLLLPPKHVRSRKERAEATHIELLSVAIAPMVHGMRVNLAKEDEEGDGVEAANRSNAKMQLTERAGQNLNETANIMLINIVDTAVALAKRDGRVEISPTDVRIAFGLLTDPALNKIITDRQNALLEAIKTPKKI